MKKLGLSLKIFLIPVPIISGIISLIEYSQGSNLLAGIFALGVMFPCMGWLGRLLAYCLEDDSINENAQRSRS